MASHYWRPIPRLPFACLLLSVVALAAGAQERAPIFDLAERAAHMQARPGDRVIVHVYGEPGLSDAATLDEKGRITLPKIGMIQASALSIADLRDTVRSRLSAI